MDDGLKGIILIIVVLLISLFFFVYIIKELVVVFLLIAMVLIPLLGYTCLAVITTKWDNYKATKEWQKVEEIKQIRPPAVGSILESEKKP